jgi:hypothetical protein
MAFDEKTQMKLDLMKSRWAALNALGADEFSGVELRMHKSGMFTAAIEGRVEIGNKHTLSSMLGRGKTPEEAIDDLWTQATQLKPDEFLVLNAMRNEKRRHVKWNGFMWADIAVSP